MKESLEYARSIYHYLIITSVIILFLAHGKKYIPNPYYRALQDIEKVENTLIYLKSKGKIAFAYDKGFFVVDSLLLLKTKKNVIEFDSLGAILNSKERHPKELLSSVNNFLGNYRQFYMWNKTILQNNYEPDSMRLVDVELYSERYLKKMLFEEIYDEYPEFPRFYLDNYNNRVSDIKKILKLRSEAIIEGGEKEVDVFGVKVNTYSSLIFLPLLPLCLLLYFLSQLIHISRTIRLKEDIDTINSFSFIAFYKDSYSFLVCMISLMMPFFGATAIAYKSNLTANEIVFWKWFYVISFPTSYVVVLALIVLIRLKCDKNKTLN